MSDRWQPFKSAQVTFLARPRWWQLWRRWQEWRERRAWAGRKIVVNGQDFTVAEWKGSTVTLTQPVQEPPPPGATYRVNPFSERRTQR
jgi:hypothetical protein